MNISFFTTGLALFAMFFGAGNIIFPLALGQTAIHPMPWSLLGLLLTGVVMPFAGLIAMFFYQGNIREFFSGLGKIPGLILASLTIALLGPFGAAPRCIALAHSTLSLSLPGIPLIVFSGLVCLAIFLFSYRKNHLLSVLGSLLSPIKITLLLFIIVKGCFGISLLSGSTVDYWSFVHGLKEGYNTMDLLAAFFFAPIVLSALPKTTSTPFILKASAIGAILLSSIYLGFYYLAYFYKESLQGIAPDQLLGAIAIHILGPYAGVIVSLTVTIACFTTAIALIAAFAGFLHKEILQERFRYTFVLIGSLLMTFVITTLEFRGIALFLAPILTVFYPVLIVLTFVNLLTRVWQYSSLPVRT